MFGHKDGMKMPRLFLPFALLCLFPAVPARAAESGDWLAKDAGLQWIWDEGGGKKNQELWFRHDIEIPADSKVASARLYTTCDNQMDLFLNGQKAGTSPDWPEPIEITDAAALLQKGKNVIAIRAKNAGGSAALIFKLEVTLEGGNLITVVSDPNWKMTSQTPAAGWEGVAFDDSTWNETVKSIAKVGAGPWGIPNYTSKAKGGNSGPTQPKDITVIDGFKVELLYTVPREEEGSWVSLTKGPGGKLFASDQGGKGMYEITPTGDGVAVEKVPAEVSGAWGMTWFQDSLYANLNGKTLVRLHDSTGDGKLDAVETLPGSNGGGEHGNHAVIPTEDGKQLYIVGGNHANLMEYTASRVQSWDEDLLLPRQWDARGHARGRLAPGGWVSLFDPAEKTYEVFATGFRNEYDVALNRNGDLFTYDADMEWDLGMPWYRPTRICQVASGADYGWRSGTGKWPTYYEDSLPPVIEIGPGSPTGVVSGTGAKFPAKYQDAIYALDWTFGTIYAIHLEEDGAGYKATKEPFLYGIPLPLTDAIVGDDGAFYFTVGGRNTQSALYRVTSETGVSAPEPSAPNPARAAKQELEAFHGKVDAKAVAAALPHLASGDRFLRHAARVAIESQPTDQWADLVLKAESPQTRITGSVALARSGDPKLHRSAILTSLLELDPSSLEESQLLGLLRAYALDFIRLGRPDPAERNAVIAALDPLLPHRSANVNTELVRVLVYLEAPSVVAKTMSLIENRGAPETPDWTELASRNPGYGATVLELLKNHPPSREIGYAFMLRNRKSGWRLEERRQFFAFLNEAAKFKGGVSYTGFLTNLRDEALGNCSNEERAALSDVTGESFNPAPDFTITPPAGPGQIWTIDTAAPFSNSGALKKASFESGRSLFHAIGCAACHRFAGLGGDIGPDLTSIRTKFTPDYVLESLINPGSVISDQYGSFTVTLKDGTLHTGLVVEKDDTVDVYPAVNSAEPVILKRADIASIEQSPVSPMPPGLINLLNGEELRDLIAYLMSGGDETDKVYGQ
jgi:putative heme-binding domain-containing protein